MRSVLACLRGWAGIGNDLSTSVEKWLSTSGGLVGILAVALVSQPQLGLAGSAGWAEGDWNGDGLFNSTDLVLAFQDGGYVAAALHLERPFDFS